MLHRILDELNDGTLLAQLPPFVEGLALAGSYARGTAGPASDLDLFVILAATPSGADIYRERIEQVLGLLPVPVVRRGPVPVAHFGDSVTLLYPDGTLVQLNFNTTETIEANPMRRSSRVLLDRSGHYARLVEASRRSALDQRVVFAEYADWFVIRACYAFRSLRGGQLLKATGYLQDMRVALAQIMRLGEGKFSEERGPYLPLSRFEREVGDTSAARLGALLPDYSADGIRDCVVESVRTFESLRDEYGARFGYDSASGLILRDEVARWIAATPQS